MWTLLTSATSDLLTTRENAKEMLQLTDSKDDGFIDRLIARASARINEYCFGDGRTFQRQSYQAILPSYGGVNLQLPAYPLLNVSRVFDGTDTDSDTALTSTEYRVDTQRGVLNRDEGWCWSHQIDAGAITAIPVPNGEYKRWLVEFSAGYNIKASTNTGFGTTSTGVSLPGDVEDACLELVKSAYLSRARTDEVQSESVGDVSVSYFKGLGGGRAMPQTVKDLLTPYRSLL